MMDGMENVSVRLHISPHPHVVFVTMGEPSSSPDSVLLQLSSHKTGMQRKPG